MAIKHIFTSTKVDSADTSLVRPCDTVMALSTHSPHLSIQVIATLLV